VQQKLIDANVKKIVRTLLGIILVSVPRGKPEMEQRKEGAIHLMEIKIQ